VSIDQQRLAALTDEVDQLHHESMRTVLGKAAADRRTSRRGLLVKAGAGGALLSLGALAGPVSQFVPAAFAKDLDDATIVAFFASLEFALAETYQTILDSGTLTTSARKTARTFQAHHIDHGRAVNDIIAPPSAAASGSAPTITTTEKPNAKVVDFYDAKLKAATGEKELLDVAYSMEEAAAATYLSALGLLQDQSDAELAATILPVESQHAVVLGEALNKPVTDYMPPFQNDLLALDPSEYPV